VAIVLQGTPTSGLYAGHQVLTISYTLIKGSGNNRCVVTVWSGFASAGGSSGQGSLSSCTFNGVSMTKAAQIESSTGVTACSSIWYMLDADLPASGGAYDVSGTFSGAAVGYEEGGVYELSGVDQTNPINTSGTLAQPNGSVTTTPNITLTTTTDNSYITDVLSSGGASSAPFTTTGTNQTAKFTIGSDNSRYMSSSVMTTTTHGNYTPGWNVGGTLPGRQSMAAVAWAPAAGVAATAPFLLVFCRK